MVFPTIESATIESRASEYAAGGRCFVGWLTHDGGKRPGILVCHEGSGLGDHAKERAGMLAEIGCVAFAPDLFGETFRSREHGIAVITDLVNSPLALRERTNAALDLLRSHPQVDPAHPEKSPGSAYHA